MQPVEFLEKLGEELVQDVTANGRLRAWTKSAPLLGAYAEATARRLIRNIVSPLRVSHGAVVWEGNTPARMTQMDTVIWQPNPVPAVFEVDDFALVPRGSAHACLEVKSSGYKKVVRAVERFEAQAKELFAFDWFTPRVLAPSERMMGVVCVLWRKQHGDSRMEAMRNAGRLVVLLEESNGGELVPQPQDIYRLINFLTKIRAAARRSDGRYLVQFRHQ